MNQMCYSIITACKNEVKFVRKTLESVVNQTILPIQWIIIDDDSSDGTAKIIEDYEKKYVWITKYKLKNFQPNIKTISRVAYLLNYAISKLNEKTDFICKLDSDIEFGANFFEKLINEFYKNSKLGIASGNLVFKGKAEKIIEGDTRGATMLIRYEILQKINGFFESEGRGEDVLLSTAARYYGWHTKSFPIYFNHLKPEGYKNSTFYNSYLTGYYKGSIPYHCIYFLITQVKHIFFKPYLLGSAIEIAGYIYARFIKKYRPFPKYIYEQTIFEQKKKLLKLNLQNSPRP